MSPALPWNRVAAILLAAGAALLLAVSADSGQGDRGFFGLWPQASFLTAVGLLVAALGASLLRRPRARARLGFVLYVVAISWLLLEVVGWLGFVDWETRLKPRDPLGVKRSPGIEVEGFTYQDAAWSWRVAGEPVRYRYRTDALGFRNDVDRDEADVYLLGDSMVVGSKVPFRETVAGRLEAEIERPVMNVSLIAKGVQASQRIFRATELPVEDRLVLQFVFEGNDLKDSAQFRRREQRERGRRGRGLWSQSLATQLLVWVRWSTQPASRRAERQSCEIGDQRYLFGWVRQTFEPFEAEQLHVYEALEGFGREVAAAGGRYGIVFLPSKLRVLAPVCAFPEGSDLVPTGPHLSPLRDSIQVWSRASGVPVLDITEPLQRAARDGEIPWFWGDTHWNEVGHEVAARALASWDLVREAAPGR